MIDGGDSNISMYVSVILNNVKRMYVMIRVTDPRHNWMSSLGRLFFMLFDDEIDLSETGYIQWDR